MISSEFIKIDANTSKELHNWHYVFRYMLINSLEMSFITFSDWATHTSNNNNTTGKNKNIEDTKLTPQLIGHWLGEKKTFKDYVWYWFSSTSLKSKYMKNAKWKWGLDGGKLLHGGMEALYESIWGLDTGKQTTWSLLNRKICSTRADACLRYSIYHQFSPAANCLLKSQIKKLLSLIVLIHLTEL